MIRMGIITSILAVNLFTDLLDNFEDNLAIGDIVMEFELELQLYIFVFLSLLAHDDRIWRLFLFMLLRSDYHEGLTCVFLF